MSTASKTAADQQLLQDVLTLMAYNEPESSPEGYLLTDSHKANLATAVNAAILTHKGQWPDSKLERLLKQLVSFCAAAPQTFLTLIEKPVL